jgi:hypothetical protein
MFAKPLGQNLSKANFKTRSKRHRQFDFLDFTRWRARVGQVGIEIGRLAPYRSNRQQRF